MQEIPLGQYSYLIEEDFIRQRLQEDYFMEDVYKGLVYTIDRRLRDSEWELEDDIFSKEVGVATLFFEGPGKDWELTMRVKQNDDGEPFVDLIFIQNEERIAEASKILTGNRKNDIKSTANRIMDIIQTKVI